MDITYSYTAELKFLKTCMLALKTSVTDNFAKTSVYVVFIILLNLAEKCNLKRIPIPINKI